MYIFTATYEMPPSHCWVIDGIIECNFETRHFKNDSACWNWPTDFREPFLKKFTTDGKNSMTFLVGSCGCDFMVVGFTTICAISAYHH